jgi:zinc/manganese transport system ATP-binding protein
MTAHSADAMTTIVLSDATFKRGNRILFENLNLKIDAGEFIAVLGSNGAGKTSLLKVLMGLLPLNGGTAQVLNEAVKRGDKNIGYIPQQKGFDIDIPIRGRDLVAFGVNGFRYGIKRGDKRLTKQIDDVIEAVGCSEYAHMPLGLLSGGEQQRLRVAQAIVGTPKVLLCDEPLLSLDMTSQVVVTGLINDYRRTTGASVVFVTHEINPILQFVDKILYLSKGRWVVDKPEVVLQSKILSELYGSSVEVLRINGRVIVLGAEDVSMTAHGGHHNLGA